MEEEKIIVNNEENNNDIIDIEENINDIPHNETVQIIEVDEPEIYTVDTDEAFSSLGEQNGQLNHSLMHGRDLPDQHPISAIVGLRKELDEIESLKTVESDKRGCANYYMWNDGQNDFVGSKVGYFVSIHTRDHKISICNEDTDIFGVTVSSAGFVGWQHYDEENNPRDDQYALVANTGVVKVRCRSTVVAGDYVMSGNDGMAKRTTNKHGYYVISIDDTDGTRYAVISLDSTMNQLYSISQEVDKFNDRVSTVEINTAAAINAANAALKKGIMTGVNTAINNAQTALDNSEFAMGAVDDLKGALSEEMEQIKAEALATQEANKNTINELKQDALDTNKAVEDLQSNVAGTQEGIQNTLDEARRLADELAEINRYLSNDYIECEKPWEEVDPKEPGKIYYVKDKELYYYFDTKIDRWVSTSEPTEAGLSEAIVSVRQKIAENEAAIEELASYTGKDYETIPVWNGYERVADFDSIVPDSNIIYYDSSSGLWWQCDLSNSDSPWLSSSNQPSVNAAGSDVSAGGSNPLELKDISQTYYAEDTGLYYYYKDGWHATVSPSVAALTEAVALTKKKADKNEASIETIVSYIGGEGSTIADVKNFADNTNATISSLTSYIENGYEKCEVPWSEVEPKESGKIYYAKDSDDNGLWKYWYYKNDTQTWYGSVNPSDAGLKVSAVNVQQTASDNEARIKKLINWQGETNTAISLLQQIADETGASIESLVMNISQYSVGKYSQAFGLTISEAKELLRDGVVFIPSENTDESYKKDDDSFYKRNFIKGYYYTWDKASGTWSDNGNSGGVRFITRYVRGSETSPYIVVTDEYSAAVEEIDTMENFSPTDETMYYVRDESKYYYYNSEWYSAQDPNFEIGLYHWEQKYENDDDSYYWRKVSALESNLLGRSVGKIRQSVSEIESTVSGVRGDLSTVKQAVDDVKALYIATTNFDGNMTSFEQKSTVDSATLSMLAMTGIIVTANWDEAGKDTTKVYYDNENKLYYFYDNGWVSTNDNKDENIDKRIKSAGIITAINSDISKVTINADRINLSGYVTVGSLTHGGTTEIDGSRIKTGYIRSDNYSEGGPVSTYSATTDLGFSSLSNGWYEANDVASDGDYARCLITFTVIKQGNVVFEVENDCQRDSISGDFISYGVFTNYDDWETAKNDELAYKFISGDVKSSYVYEDLSPGTYSKWIYYKKAEGVDINENHFRFRVSPKVLPKAGTSIDLVNGSIKAPNFTIDEQGNARLQGLLETNNVQRTNITIDGNDIIWRDKRVYPDDIKNKYRTAGILLEPSDISFTENDYTECSVPWADVADADRETNKIYYAEDENGVWQYWYFDEGTQEWVSTSDPADAGVGGVKSGQLYIGSSRNISFCGFYGNEAAGEIIKPLETIRIDQYIHTTGGYPRQVGIYPVIDDVIPAGVSKNNSSYLGSVQYPWKNLFADYGRFNVQVSANNVTAQNSIDAKQINATDGFKTFGKLEARSGSFTTPLGLGYLEADKLVVNGSLSAESISGAIDYDSISSSVSSALSNFKGTLNTTEMTAQKIKTNDLNVYHTLDAHSIMIDSNYKVYKTFRGNVPLRVLQGDSSTSVHILFPLSLSNNPTIVCGINNNCNVIIECGDTLWDPSGKNMSKVYHALDSNNELKYYKFGTFGWKAYDTKEDLNLPDPRYDPILVKSINVYNRSASGFQAVINFSEEITATKTFELSWIAME